VLACRRQRPPVCDGAADGAARGTLTTLLLVGAPYDDERAAAAQALRRSSAPADCAVLGVHVPAGHRLLWGECRESGGRRGLHTYPDLELVQAVDAESGEASGSGPRELVLTQLGLRGTALLRWRTGDLVEQVDTSACPSCGRTVPRVAGTRRGALVPPLAMRSGPVDLDVRAVTAALLGRPDVEDWRVVTAPTRAGGRPAAAARHPREGGRPVAGRRRPRAGGAGDGGRAAQPGGRARSRARCPARATADACCCTAEAAAPAAPRLGSCCGLPRPCGLDAHAAGGGRRRHGSPARLAHHGGQRLVAAHRGRSARRVVEESRESLAAALGARPSEVVFTAGGTESDNLAVKGIWWSRHDADPRRTRILASAVEHHAVLDAVEWLAAHEGATVEWLEVDRVGRVHPDVLAEAIERDPSDVALVSVMWANNEVGTVQPVRALADVAHEHGIPSTATPCRRWASCTSTSRERGRRP
jgi:hypothetical protein